MRSRPAQIMVGLAMCSLMGLVGLRMSARAQPPKIMMIQDPVPIPSDRPAEPPQVLPPDPEPTKPGGLAPPPVEVPANEAVPPRPLGRKGSSVALTPPTAFAPDPAKDAEAFVAKTYKEAAAMLAALEKESGELRVRLAKIEAASTRLRTAFRIQPGTNVLRTPPSDDLDPKPFVRSDIGDEPQLQPSVSVPRGTEPGLVPSEPAAPKTKP